LRFIFGRIDKNFFCKFLKLDELTIIF